MFVQCWIVSGTTLTGWCSRKSLKNKTKHHLQCSWLLRPLSSSCGLLSNQLGPWTHSHAQWTQTTWPIEYPTDCVISACWIKNKHTGWLAFFEETGTERGRLSAPLPRLFSFLDAPQVWFTPTSCQCWVKRRVNVVALMTFPLNLSNLQCENKIL